MDVLGVLGLRVDGAGALSTLQKFTGSAHNAGRATEHFERTTKNLTNSLRVLGGYFGVRQLVEYADTWTLINARVRLVTRSTEEARAVQERLYRTAQRTRNTLAATSVLYTRVALNADQLGRSNEELLQVVESVNAAMLLSGATGVEAAQAMRQFAQALGSGRVQGDEFRTMMEAMPLVARSIADEMGVALGDLYKLSREGLIDVQTVIDALIKDNARLVEQAETMPFTVGQAFELINNSLVRIVGILNMAWDISRRLADGLQAVANNMDKVVAGLLAAVALFVSRMVVLRTVMASVWLYTQLMTAAATIRAWISLAAAVRRVSDVMALIQITARGLAGVAAAVAAVTIGVAAYRKILAEIEEATRAWEEANADLTDPLGDPAERLDENAARVRNQIEDMIRLAHQEVVLAGTAEAQQDRLEIRFDAVNKRIEARRDLTGELLDQMLEAIDLEESLRLEALAYADALDKLTEAIEEEERILNRFMRSLQSSFADVFSDIFNEGIEKFSDLFDAVKRLFYRMVAEMAAAQIMRQLGPSMLAALGGIFGTTSRLGALEQSAAGAVIGAQAHMTGAIPEAGKGGKVPVEIKGITATASESWAAKTARFLGPVLAGFAVGRLVGGMTTNRAVGTGSGALSGALTGAAIGSAIPGVGTAAGGLVGGLAGALGGFLGASNRQQEESERLRAQLEANRLALAQNNLRLQEMKDAFEGRPNALLLSARTRAEALTEARGGGRPAWASLSIEDRALLSQVASSLGFTLFSPNANQGRGGLDAGAWDAFLQAMDLAVLNLTQWSNNLSDATRRQEAYNKLFDIGDSPLQSLKDAYDIFGQLSPELLSQFGLANLNLDSPEARATLVAGLRDLFLAIDSGFFTNNPQLLGSFDSIDQLIEVMLRTKDAFDELNKVLFDFVTDFPRAMDLAFYEQLYGTYGLGRQRGPRPDPRGIRPMDPPASRTVTIGAITIVNTSDDDGETLLTKIEDAVYNRRLRGGSVDLNRTGEGLF